MFAEFWNQQRRTLESSFYPHFLQQRNARYSQYNQFQQQGNTGYPFYFLYPQQRSAGYQQYQEIPQQGNAGYPQYQQSPQQRNLRYSQNQEFPGYSQYQQYYNNPQVYTSYETPQEPINPETFDYFGKYQNSYGQAIIRPYPNYKQQDLPKLENVNFATKIDTEPEEDNDDDDDEEMIDLPPVEDNRGILSNVLGNLYESLTQSQNIKNQEKPYKKERKDGSSKIKKHVEPTTVKLETDECEFDSSDLFFPTAEFAARLKRCEEIYENMKKNEETGVETTTDKSEEEKEKKDIEKHVINGEECVCVLYFQCDGDDNVITDGKTLIDVRYTNYQYVLTLRRAQSIF